MEYKSKPTRVQAIQMRKDNIEEVVAWAKERGGAILPQLYMNPPMYEAIFPIEDTQSPDNPLGDFASAVFPIEEGSWIMFSKDLGRLSLMDDNDFTYFYDLPDVFLP